MPILYKCPFFTVYTYGVFAGIAFLVSSFLLMREAKRKGLSEHLVYDFCIFLLICGIISARIFYVILNWGDFQDNLIEIVMLQHGGLVWFGGLIGAALSAIVFMRLKKMPVFLTLDFFAPFVVLGQAIGRIGCFFNGCCYGKPLASGIYFPVHHMRLFPAQLLDSLTLILVFVILRMMRDGKKSGIIFTYYLMLSALQRFLMEFVRGDLRPFYLSLSIFQWVSICLFSTGVSLYLFIWKKKTA